MMMMMMMMMMIGLDIKPYGNKGIWPILNTYSRVKIMY